jgi:hypothetical protein
MGGATSSGRIRKATVDDAAGDIGSGAATVVVAGAWVMPEKRMRSHHDLLVTNLTASETRKMKITAPELARTLKANNMDLRGDGKRSRVMPRSSI